MFLDFAKIWVLGISFTLLYLQANFLDTPKAVFPLTGIQTSQKVVLSSHAIPLTDRYPIKSVSQVFADNILLTLHYMRGDIIKPNNINWSVIEAPLNYKITLQPQDVFAFHDAVLPQYLGAVVKTSNAHFNSQEGFKSDGYLYGDGVCHLASLMNWVAQDAHLKVEAPTNHNFATIPDIAKPYGTAIYYSPNSSITSAKNNLYITNTYSEPITLAFNYQNNMLSLSISEGI